MSEKTNDKAMVINQFPGDKSLKMLRKRYGFMGVGKLTSSRLRKYFLFLYEETVLTNSKICI